MGIADIPILAMLRTRMQWHQQRQQVLAQNVANADTPNYHPLELVEPKFQVADAGSAPMRLARDDPGQLPGLATRARSPATASNTKCARPAMR